MNNYITENDNNRVLRFDDLPEYSPFICGELMFRNIIKNLTEKSKLNFIFLQLNSGGGYDYIKEANCYLLKMIPLVVLKNHLLNISEDYFFIYSKIRADEYAFTDAYTYIVLYNEILIFECEDIAYQESEDNSIKLGLTNVHEKGGHIKYKRKDQSPRYLISNELDLYDNYSEEANGGESGNALEFMLLGDKYYFSKLLKSKNLKKLGNYKLFVEEDSSNLLREINIILKKNKLKIVNISEKKIINSNSKDIDGSKYADLKNRENNFVKSIKKKLNELNKN